MKIACCICGKIGGAKGKDGKGGKEKEILELSYKHFKDHILDKNDTIDFFIHCWDTDMEKEVTDLYKPKSSHFEKQKYFDIPKCFKVGVKSKKTEPNRPNNIYSRFYSTKESVKLKMDYEKEHGFKYDCVLLCRFDIAWQKDIIFSNHNMEDFHVANLCSYRHKGKRIDMIDFYKNRSHYKKLPIDHRHVGYPYRENSWGLWDQWFFSNSNNMDKFSNVFDNIEKHIKINSRLQDEVSSHLLCEVQLKHVGLEKRIKFPLHFLEDTPMTRLWYYNYFN